MLQSNETHRTELIEQAGELATPFDGKSFNHTKYTGAIVFDLYGQFVSDILLPLIYNTYLAGKRNTIKAAVDTFVAEMMHENNVAHVESTDIPDMLATLANRVGAEREKEWHRTAFNDIKWNQFWRNVFKWIAGVVVIMAAANLIFKTKVGKREKQVRFLSFDARRVCSTTTCFCFCSRP